MTEPKKHHYIPQFVLRNYLNKDGQVFYWDLQRKFVESRNTKSIFMNNDMYRDEINHPDDPTIIERTLSYFESEIAQLIQEKFSGKGAIIITRAELEKLRIFMLLLSFRSDLRMKQYKYKYFDKATKDILKIYQSNEDFEDLWKKEVYEFAKCRSYDDVEKSPVLDPILKEEFLKMLKGYYMTVVDARGGEFILSDVLPTLEIFPIPNDPIYMHEIYPISPTRIILLNLRIFGKDVVPHDRIEKEILKLSRIQGNLVKQPQVHRKFGQRFFIPEDIFSYTPVKVYKPELTYINSLILNEVRNGVMFLNKERIVESVEIFNKRDDTKRRYLEFEKALREHVV